MNTAALLTALLVVAALALLWAARRGRLSAFCAGPSNIGLYDSPFYYPRYVARTALAWDSDRRCVAYCGVGDCAIWCR
jgi:hypothetical protein